MAERRRKTATTQAVQAAVEGVLVDDPRKVEFKSQTFLMAETIGLMPLLKFAHASSRGIDSNDIEGLVALYEMIRDCIDQERPKVKQTDEATGETKTVELPSEWERFQQHAIDTKAEAEDLMSLVQVVISRIAARPTQPPGDSSAGRPAISASSKASSSSQVLEGMVSPEDL